MEGKGERIRGKRRMRERLISAESVGHSEMRCSIWQLFLATEQSLPEFSGTGMDEGFSRYFFGANFFVEAGPELYFISSLWLRSVTPFQLRWNRCARAIVGEKILFVGGDSFLFSATVFETEIWLMHTFKLIEVIMWWRFESRGARWGK